MSIGCSSKEQTPPPPTTSNNLCFLLNIQKLGCLVQINQFLIVLNRWRSSDESVLFGCWMQDMKWNKSHGIVHQFVVFLWSRKNLKNKRRCPWSIIHWWRTFSNEPRNDDALTHGLTDSRTHGLTTRVANNLARYPEGRGAVVGESWRRSHRRFSHERPFVVRTNTSWYCLQQTDVFPNWIFQLKYYMS